MLTVLFVYYWGTEMGGNYSLWARMHLAWRTAHQAPISMETSPSSSRGAGQRLLISGACQSFLNLRAPSDGLGVCSVLHLDLDVPVGTLPPHSPLVQKPRLFHKNQVSGDFCAC